MGLSEPATGSLALGSAFHATLAANFRHKISTKRDAAVDEMQALFAEEFALAMKEAELRYDEDAHQLESIGTSLIAVYLAEASPSIQPAAVELEVEGVIAGVRARGFRGLA